MRLTAKIVNRSSLRFCEFAKKGPFELERAEKSWVTASSLKFESAEKNKKRRWGKSVETTMKEPGETWVCHVGERKCEQISVSAAVCKEISVIEARIR
jgi:hypothetical protein